jgi:hypothetical protein
MCINCSNSYPQVCEAAGDFLQQSRTGIYHVAKIHSFALFFVLTREQWAQHHNRYNDNPQAHFNAHLHSAQRRAATRRSSPTYSTNSGPCQNRTWTSPICRQYPTCEWTLPATSCKPRRHTTPTPRSECCVRVRCGISTRDLRSTRNRAVRCSAHWFVSRLRVRLLGMGARAS